MTFQMTEQELLAIGIIRGQWWSHGLPTIDVGEVAIAAQEYRHGVERLVDRGLLRRDGEVLVLREELEDVLNPVFDGMSDVKQLLDHDVRWDEAS